MIREDLANLWYQAIFSRYSVRAYERKTVPRDFREEIESLLNGFSPMCNGARAVLLEDGAEEILCGFWGIFGKIRGADMLLVLIGETSHPNYEVAVGFLGEGIILHATSQGLGTCWVAGTYSRRMVEARVNLGDSEKIMAVSPIGFAQVSGTDMEGKSVQAPRVIHRRKPLQSIMRGLPVEDFPAGCLEMLEAARLAPSAINRQPWRFMVEPDGITVSAAGFELLPMTARRLDCGIAMLHLEVAARAHGIHGEWKYITEPPAVAKYVVLP